MTVAALFPLSPDKGHPVNRVELIPGPGPRAEMVENRQDVMVPGFQAEE